MLSYLESYPNIKLRDNHREICYIKLNTIKHTIHKINVHNTQVITNINLQITCFTHILFSLRIYLKQTLLYYEVRGKGGDYIPFVSNLHRIIDNFNRDLKG